MTWFPKDVSEHLADEVRSPIRCEYVGGHSYAMAGASNRHNQIATNALIALGARLRGKPCRPFHSDTKVRIRLPRGLHFYYPDAMVVCRPNPPEDAFQDEPLLVLEVLSPDTRRIDEGEKCFAYAALPSMRVILLVEPDVAQVVVLRRAADGFERETYGGTAARVPLPELGCELPLAELYEGLTLTPAAFG